MTGAITLQAFSASVADQKLVEDYTTTYPAIGEFLKQGVTICAEMDHRHPPQSVSLSASHLTSFCTRQGCLISAGQNHVALWHEGKQAVLRWNEQQIYLDLENRQLPLGPVTEQNHSPEAASVFSTGFKYVLGIK